MAVPLVGEIDIIYGGTLLTASKHPLNKRGKAQSVEIESILNVFICDANIEFITKIKEFNFFWNPHSNVISCVPIAN